MLLIEIINHNIQAFDMHTLYLFHMECKGTKKKNVEFFISKPKQMEVLSGGLKFQRKSDLV